MQDPSTHRHLKFDISPDFKLILKRFPAYFIPLSLLSAALLAGIYMVLAQNDLKTLESKEQIKLRLQEELILNEIESVLSDLFYIAEEKSLNKFVKMQNENDLHILEQQFLIFSRLKSIYDQIRYIDETGMEIVRVNCSNGVSGLVSSGQLQRKNRRPYFQKGMALDKGHIHVSPFDLNIDHGRIEIPIKPTIRFCTPVFDDTGQKKGIVVLNYLGETLLSHINKGLTDARYPSWLLNADGYWLYSDQPDQNWGFMYENKKDTRLKHRFPYEWDVITREENGRIKTDHGLFSFLTIHPLARCLHKLPSHSKFNCPNATLINDRYHWILVSYVSPANLAGGTVDLRLIIFLLLCLTVLVCALITYFFLRNRVIRQASAVIMQELVQLKDSLISASSVISGETDLKSTLKEALQSARRLVDARHGALVLMKDGEIIGFLYDAPPSEHMPPIKDGRHNNEIFKALIEDGNSIRLSDVSKHPRFSGFPPHHPPIKTLLGVPLIYQNELLGGLYLTGKKKNADFSEQDESIIKILGNHIAAMIDKTALYEEIRLGTKIFDNSIEGICITDSEGTILKINRAFTAITGYEAEDVIGRNPRILKSDRHDEAFYRIMWESLLQTGQWEGEIWNRRKNGETYPEWLSVSAIRNIKGQTIQYVSIFHDISEVKKTHEELKYQAYHDALTQLPNRQLFLDRLTMALVRAKRHEEKLAVLFLDLDNFKNVNDTLGHKIGDLLLQDVARRLAGTCRDEDTVARLGGDEFIILMADLKNTARDAAGLAKRILRSLNTPFEFSGKPVITKASIGITLFPNDGNTTEDLIKNADMAMYKAKHEGKNQYAFFTDEMNRNMVRRVSLENDIRNALNHRELEIYYQPKVSMESGFISGAEALSRWHRKGSEMIPPDEFIPIAEETGFIIEMGAWVLSRACAQAQSWSEMGWGNFSIAVNLSPMQFRNNHILELVQQVLQETGLAPELLTLEITENVMVYDIEITLAIMERIAALGVHWSIDDFGTGYSSMRYLQRLPINELKIDKSFVDGIPANVTNQKIVESTVALAHAFDLKVVAEGVEKKEQLAFLGACGCHEAQGYLYSRPLPPNDFTALLRQTRRNMQQNP